MAITAHKPIRKTIAAFIGCVGTWATAVFAGGGTSVSSAQWTALGVALAVALGVYNVPNEPAAPAPAPDAPAA